VIGILNVVGEIRSSHAQLAVALDQSEEDGTKNDSTKDSQLHRLLLGLEEGQELGYGNVARRRGGPDVPLRVSCMARRLSGSNKGEEEGVRTHPGR